MTRLLSTILAVLCLITTAMPVGRRRARAPQDARGGRGRARPGRREVARGGPGPACRRARVGWPSWRSSAFLARASHPSCRPPAGRSRMSLPSCALIRLSSTPTPITWSSWWRTKVASPPSPSTTRRRRANTRSTGCGCATHGRSRRAASGVVAILDTGVQANHPDLVGRVLRRLRLREHRYERGRRQRPRNLGRRHHCREPERRLRDRRHQLEGQDPAGQGHVRHRHRRYRRPDRRDHLGGEPRRNRHQHERGWLSRSDNTCRTR